MDGRSAASRLGAVAMAVALAVGLVSGCSSEGADVSCNLSTCTVTFDRDADAKASVLGVDVKLVGVENDQVTLDISGSQVVLPVGDSSQETETGGLSISIQEVTSDQVVLRVTQA
ncbi:MAG: hypothetical protein HKP61_08065 [Dactylosporangium sp.]|nr:hypothetical protein [Dactylosporangium sp.]NNJ60892.1 hypothetical protein [Dactylosporangium sp.]